MKIGIIGLGLMGASLGRAIIKHTSHEVLGLDADDKITLRATELAAQTRPLSNDDYKKLDLVIFALAPKVAVCEMRRVCPLLKDGATVADICGNKRLIADEMKSLKAEFPALHFIGTHPMAGREFSGIEYSTPDLFKGAYAILVPVEDDYPIQILKDLYLEIGARGVEICTASRHDEMIAYTSQLAHAVSSCFVQNPLSSQHVGYSAGSFADLTRVARLNPDIWTELFLQNADNLSRCMDDIIDRLQAMNEAIKHGDGASLKAMLARGAACKETADEAARRRDE